MHRRPGRFRIVRLFFARIEVWCRCTTAGRAIRRIDSIVAVTPPSGNIVRIGFGFGPIPCQDRKNRGQHDQRREEAAAYAQR